MCAHLRLEVARDPAELLASRRLQDQVDLAAEPVLALHEHDTVAALRQRLGRLHAGRAAAGDEEAPRRVRRRRRSEAPLPPRRGVDGAADRQALEHAGDAALVAADAVVDLVLAIFADLVRKLGIGDLRPRHRDHVRLARGDDLLRQRRVLDPSDREDRQVAHRRLDGRSEIDEVAVRRVGRLDGHEDVVVAGRCHVDVVDPAVGLEVPGDAHGVLDVQPTGDEVAQADAYTDDEVRPDASADLLDHLARETKAVLERAAVLVGSLVVERREELMQEVAVRNVHLGAVEAAFARELGRAPPPLDHLAHVLGLHRLRRLPVRG